MKNPCFMKTARFQAAVPVMNALDATLAGRAVRRILTSLAALGLAGLASVQAQTFTPIPLTPASFTVNTVIPVDWTYKLNAQSVSVTIDHGPALQVNTVSDLNIYAHSIDPRQLHRQHGDSGGLDLQIERPVRLGDHRPRPRPASQHRFRLSDILFR